MISIRYKIIITAVLMVILPISLTAFYFYWNITSILTSNVNNNLSQLVRQTNDNIENSFNIIDNTSMQSLSNKAIRSWTTDDSSSGDDNYNNFINKSQMEEELKYNLMFNNAWRMKLITTAFIFLDENTFCSASRSMKNVQIDNENNTAIYKKLSGRLIRGMVIVPPSYNDKTVYFVRTLTNEKNPKRRLFLILGTDENQLFEKYSGLLDFSGSLAYIIDDKGIIYSSPEKSKLGSTIEKNFYDLRNKSGVHEVTLDGQTYIVASRKISQSGLTFIAGIPKAHVLAKLSSSVRNYLLVVLLIVFVFLLSSILISFRFTRFLRDLLKNINKIKVGDYDAKMPAYKDTDLSLLSNTFNNMTGEIKYLINQVYEKQLLLKETEFKFLQSQMNPHFLFNTLVTIGYKARLSQDETVYKMVTSLTELLQSSIYTNSSEKVSIRRELEFVEFYLYLQKVRFEDKLEYHINILGESIPDYCVPKLSIEPIVENAVVHGLEGKIGKGTVNILVREDSNSVYFEISDDGIGFDTENINLDSSESVAKRKKGHNCIGLKNTHKRIKLMYGEQYGITISSEYGKGSNVVVHIPIDTGDGSNV